MDLEPGTDPATVGALGEAILLRTKGHPTFPHFGVAPPFQGRLRAHAWVESGGRVLIGGGAGLAAFTPLKANGGTHESR
jgi:hypothetical protein